MWHFVAVLYEFYITHAVRCWARIGTGTNRESGWVITCWARIGTGINRESGWVITCPRGPGFVLYYDLFLMVL